LLRLSDEARHQIRIEAKKLRYNSELLGSLFPKQGKGRFLKRCERLQKHLGDLNDIAGSHGLASSIVEAEGTDLGAGAQGRIGFTAGLVVGHREGRVPALLEAADGAARRFRKVEGFW
jgi:hypothetical protein